MRLERLILRRLALPLAMLADDIRQLDIVLVEATLAGGGIGYGEAALAPGIAPETLEQGWIVGCKLAELSAGMESDEALQLYARSRGVAPFTVSALTAAVEMAAGHEALAGPAAVVPVGVVDAGGSTPIEETVEECLGRGAGALRVVLAGDLASDLAALEGVAAAAAGRARLRIEGNQAFATEDAVALAREIDPEGVDWLAQPCVAGDWEAAVAVRAASAVPTLIRGFVYGDEDIALAAGFGAADLVGLRLMQAGGLSACVGMAARLRDHGLTPVLGGGPQTDLSTWMEGCLLRHLGDAVVADFVDPAASILGPDGRSPALDIVEGRTEHLLSFSA